MDKTTHFGYKEVPTKDKEKLVKGVFDSVASNYDLMNDVMSFGIHRLWKQYAIDIANVKKGDAILDLASGTGDLIKLYHKKIGNSGRIVSSDINEAMLDEGKRNLINSGVLGIEFVQANAEKLPFEDNSFDLVSIAFGLRNVTDKDKALSEMCRVLKPGGVLIVLEFSKTTNPVLEKIYDAYSFNLIPKFGSWFAGDEDSYQYLAESIRKHPDQETLKQMIIDAGFDMCEYQNLTGGVVAIHKGIKI
ncbi:MAG: bifunctional demethylmenaquinone methyltransferase/2-methoxy-6-polyprenyl-1,4-benzoquinol methylase UbiE [Gammaproteobacteria bacterium]|jgi:demethylmenaquinone methyltransferase/2-methoxy-6-polyprenyl-1,4-benzoquinol methylase|nr:bifunctional demethylmenaquinone methyltransferase/2-methoxy-6-polyprenyl-1,4-benzoquinol methylase UbiE [Gammaproteobacteria bacterium]